VARPDGTAIVAKQQEWFGAADDEIPAPVKERLAALGKERERLWRELRILQGERTFDEKGDECARCRASGHHQPNPSAAVQRAPPRTLYDRRSRRCVHSASG